jgi:FkbM family methyltransferase
MNAPFAAGLAPSADLIFPGACVTGKFELRNPFLVRDLTWQCREHLALYRQDGGGSLRGMVRFWWRRKRFRAARSRSSLPQGKASLRVGAEWRDFSFNASNTQFESIYAPSFVHGYEPETAVLIDALLPANGVMMDIGANWGHFSLFASSRPGFTGRVHAFEPMPSTYADLVASVQATRMGNIVTTHSIAVADREGTSHMSIPGGEKSGLASLGDNTGTPVPLSRLDALDLPAPDLMKIDVEGHEAGVLRGARQTIGKSRPMIIFESGLSDNLSGALEPFLVLEEQGYRFFMPSFVRGEGGGEIFTSYGRNEDLSGTVRLALVPFASKGRWLLQSHANIFACHAERLAEVEAIFSRANGADAVHVPPL